MLVEADLCENEAERFRWALGCWLASVRASFGAGECVYSAALATGMVVMAGYEWWADESRMTVFILSLVALVLGALRPRQAVLSGALVGLVVAGTIIFEAASGIRPAYEAQAQTLAHGLFWLILLVPAVSSAAVGRWIGRLLRFGPSAS
jgi:hypothetical protein